MRYSIRNTEFINRLNMHNYFFQFKGNEVPHGFMSHIPNGNGRTTILKYIVDNCLDDNGPFNWYWAWGTGDELPDTNSPVLKEWIKVLKDKHSEYESRYPDGDYDESPPQTLLRKENNVYRLEIQTYDYCEDCYSTFFELQEEEVLEYLTMFQDELYGC
jgi:hypothetical protein